LDENLDLPEFLKELWDRSCIHLNDEEIKQVKGLLAEYQDIFIKPDGELGRTDKVKHKIETKDALPIRQRPRRIPLHMQDEVDKIIEDMLEKKIIEPSKSPWQSPVVLVKKKDGNLRFCIDYRKLNEVTVKDSYNIPNIAQSLDCLSGITGDNSKHTSVFFSTLDLASGY
jgi:hypothetical protein